MNATFRVLNAGLNNSMKVGYKSFEGAANFTSFGAVITGYICFMEFVKSRRKIIIFLLQFSSKYFVVLSAI